MWEIPSKKWTKNEILHTLWTREQIGADLLKNLVISQNSSQSNQS